MICVFYCNAIRGPVSYEQVKGGGLQRKLIDLLIELSDCCLNAVHTNLSPQGDVFSDPTFRTCKLYAQKSGPSCCVKTTRSMIEFLKMRSSLLLL